MLFSSRSRSLFDSGSMAVGALPDSSEIKDDG